MFEPFTDVARRVVVYAQEEARGLRHDSIGTEHLLLGLTRERHDPTVQLIVRLGCDVDEIRRAAIKAISSEPRQQESLGQLRAANDLLRAEIARLRRLLGQHGIDPDDAA